LGKKGGSTGLKRKPAPRFWPVRRKEFTWVVKPSPGPHPLQESLPLAVGLRDILGFAQTRKEAKTIVSQGKICVNGKIRRKDNFPISLMDVIAISDVDKSFRILPSAKGLVLYPISKEESSFKLCRIENKTTVKNGHVQININDGSSILVKVADAKRPQEDVYTTLDTLKISLPERHVVEHVKMKEDSFAIITGGKNIGKYGKIVEIEKTKAKKRRNAFVTIEDAKGNRYQTILGFVFAIGETKPLITLPEAV
jgi:small subunit ribosomal protein S4e